MAIKIRINKSKAYVVLPHPFMPLSYSDTLGIWHVLANLQDGLFYVISVNTFLIICLNSSLNISELINQNNIKLNLVLQLITMTN
jgi:hypothetical protein